MFPRILFPHEISWFESLRAGVEAQDNNNLDEALVLLDRAVKLAIEKRLSTEQVLHSYLAYALALMDAGKPDDSESVLRRAIEFGSRSGPEDKKIHMLLLIEYGLSLFAKQKFGEAKTSFEKAIAIQNKKRFKMDADLLTIHASLLACYMALGDWEKARTHGLKTIEASSKVHGAKHEITENIIGLLALAPCEHRNQVQLKI